MANQSKLKAWVRYDGTNTVVTAGPIFRAAKPKVGNWRQINSGLCCNGSSTTTTTTGGGSVTPTAWIAYAANYIGAACGQFMGMQVIVYTATSTINPYMTIFYSDAGLTQPYSTFNGSFLNINGTVYQVNMSALVIGVQSCATTTTTTTQAPVLSFIGAGGSSTNEACNALSGTQTFYTTGPLVPGGYPQNGIIVYLDQALTQPATFAYVASPGIGQVWECFNGELYNQQNCF